MKTRTWRVMLVVGALLLAGCGGGGGKTLGRKVMKPPKRPPPPPKRVDVPVDSALRSAARAELTEALGSSDRLARAHALEALRETVGPESQDAIVEAMGDREPIVRFAAAMAAGELQLEKARESFERLVNDPDESVRLAARFGLHRVGDTRLSHDFEKTVRSFDPRTRADTALILGLLGEPSAVKLLRPLRADLDPAVRLQANEALWRLGNEQGMRSLIAGTLSGYPDDQMISLLALAAPRDRRVIEHVRAALTSDYAEVNLVAARAMGMLGSDEGYAVATKGLASADPRQRLLGALALGAIGRADAQDELAPLLKDSDQSVRIAAATALLQLK